MASFVDDPNAESSAPTPAQPLGIPGVRCLDQHLFDLVAAEARHSPRLRRNHNLHDEPDLVQRFLNVMQPATEVRPHRHGRAKPGAGCVCCVGR
ncbi:MAG: WbuC family cupin fold metalloprotein, partial [Cyanobacteriota bacterium]